VSEHEVTLVRLDVLPAAETGTIAESVRDWLLEREVVAANGRFDPLWQPSAWKPGLKASEVVGVGWSGSFLHTANNGVDIIAERGLYLPVGNDERPRCLICSAPAPDSYEQTCHTWLDRWLREGEEPWFACGNCRWAAPVGDWAGEFSAAVGAPAITFHNWPDLTIDFIAEARARLGGRTTVIRTHI